MSDDPKNGNTPENAGPGEAAPPPQAASGNGQGSTVEQLEQEKRELHDRLLRTAADFENYKRRSKKEVDDAATRGREQLLKELLPAMDNLERALKHAPPGDPLAVGVQQTEKQLLQALEKFGVTRFASVGKPFDPTVHDAIQQMETTEHPAGTVAAEFASGYMVAVAKPPAGAATGGDGGGDGNLPQ
jgi:molecular chaperone GrpE